MNVHIESSLWLAMKRKEDVEIKEGKRTHVEGEVVSWHKGGGQTVYNSQDMI